ncbi:outer membrane protein [Dinoroseobacter shibae]|jgi:outer membrane immunogenic protein|nr:outer membrane beta-barrel protein [Dinoroseobacter shibae]URF46998.1 porin family protein [Dinoroseobacter shibae]URF51309.1 porin family protein [Dinoroseobacter shibae]
MFRTATAFGLVLAASTGSLYAGNPEPAPVAPVMVAPVPAPAPFWAGGYIGAQLGYAYGDFDIDAAIDGDDNDDGFIGGLTAGYLFDVGSGWYVGPEVQYDWADLEITEDGGDTASFDEIARLKLIVGREIGNGLLYGTAGIAYGSLDSAGDVFDGIDGSDTNWLLGLGYDYRVGDNWTVGGEYMYHSFDDVDLNTLHIKAAYRF